ncbi:hypothetical protein EW146_g7194 [Bondarzewia mesenterica]|uniref:Uncharacterized protein n=1 Tax=Bondarzewia mesenterica TaxID=1095465 RepID=A0A4S4LND6_9AGAM|nr:hypothetical protein EW146_g7194 [Bondarzewia mesenterica]
MANCDINTPKKDGEKWAMHERIETNVERTKRGTHGEVPPQPPDPVQKPPDPEQQPSKNHLGQLLEHRRETIASKHDLECDEAVDPPVKRRLHVQGDETQLASTMPVTLQACDVGLKRLQLVAGRKPLTQRASKREEGHGVHENAKVVGGRHN